MHLLLIGLNHHTAPVELRERVAFDSNHVNEVLGSIAGQAGLYEAALLSTCNRTEVYGTAISIHAQDRMIRALAAAAGIEREELEPSLIQHRNGEVVTHLYRVAAGLDSLVMGEPQILGQVRAAFEAAHQAHATGPRLSKLFLSAIEVGKNVRSTTALGATPVSVSTIALHLARRLLGDLVDHRVLIVGAGAMCETAAVLAAERRPERLVITNRTLGRAQKIAALTGGTASPWVKLPDELFLADLVITATGSQTPIITQEMLSRTMEQRGERRVVIVDMGVPRDVEAGTGCADELFLYDIDDLKQIAQEHLKQRLAEVPRAEDVVARAKERYLAWLETLTVVPTIVDLRKRFETIRQAQVKQHLGKISGLDAKGQRRIEQMTQAIINTILHDPLVRLKHRAADDTGGVLAESLRYLFALDDKKESP